MFQQLFTRPGLALRKSGEGTRSEKDSEGTRGKERYEKERRGREKRMVGKGIGYLDFRTWIRLSK